MPRPATVWSQQFDSLEAFAQDAQPLTQVATGQVAPAMGGVLSGVPSAPTDDQLADARDRAQRAVDAGVITAPGSDVTIAMHLDANGVMSVQVARKA